MGVEKDKSLDEISEIGDCSMMLDESSMANPNLFEVARYYDELFEQLDVDSECPFLNSPEIKADFNEKLRVFDAYLDGHIGDLAQQLKANGDCAIFSENWEENVRFAAYHAFFVHYGAKREGEKDRDGDPRDYVYHVVRTAFNCLIRKARFFDERSLLVAILHDSREDYHKGLLGFAKDGEVTLPREFAKKAVKERVKNSGIKDEKAKDAVFNNFSLIEKKLDMAIDGVRRPGDIDLTRLILILTKETKDRNKAFLDLLEKALSVVQDPNVSFKTVDLFFSTFVRILMIKMSDRLDNMKSLRSTDKEDMKQKEIHDETIYAFLAAADSFGMVNLFDWLADNCFYRYGLDDRQEHQKIREEAGEGLEQFKADFKTQLNLVAGFDRWNPLPQEGIDYVIHFRPVPKRFESLQEVKEVYHRGKYDRRLMLNFVTFRPIGDGEKINGGDTTVSNLARSAFKTMFPDTLADVKDVAMEGQLRRPEMSTALGRVISKGRMDKNGRRSYNYSSLYGVGEWRVFDSQQEAVHELLGPLIEAFFYQGNEMDVKRVAYVKQIEDLKVEVRSLLAWYEDIFGEESGDIQKHISGKVGRTTTGIHHASTVLPSIQKQKLKELFPLLVRTLFLKKDVREVEVKISYTVEGKIRNLYCKSSKLPKGYNLNLLLALVAPQFLGMKGVGIKVANGNYVNVNLMDSAPEIDPDLEPKSRVVDFSIDQNAGFDPNLFDRQLQDLMRFTLGYYLNDLRPERPTATTQTPIDAEAL